MASGTITLGEGAAGQGVPAGGTVGQTITKLSSTDFDTAWATLGVTAAPANVRYVTKEGNDSTGNGSISNPYLTLKAALASIVDADPNNPYMVFMGPGFFIEELPFVLKSSVSITGAGTSQTNLFQDDFNAFTWTPDNTFEYLLLENLSIGGLNAISAATAESPGLEMRNVNVPFNDLVVTGGIGDYSGLLALNLRNSSFGGNCYFNATAQGATLCSFGGITVSDVATGGAIGPGPGISLNYCSHGSLTVLDNANINRNECIRGGPWTMTGAGAAIYMGETGQGDVYANVFLTFDGTDTVEYISGSTLAVGRGIISDLLPADTTVIADLGGGMWQLSASATGSAAARLSKLVRVTFTDGALISNLFVTPAGNNFVVQNSGYGPATSADWPIVPQFCGQALDLLAASRPVQTDSEGEVAIPGTVDFYINGAAEPSGPSSLVAQKVRWVKTGKTVVLFYLIQHSVDGSPVNGVDFALPAGIPAPASMWASNPNVINGGTCVFKQTEGTSVPEGGQCAIYDMATTPRLFGESNGSDTGLLVQGQITYLTEE